MGHIRTYEVVKKDYEVEAYINKCEALINKLARAAESASKHKEAAVTAVNACKTATVVETDELSGIYYEKYYIPYRDKFFALADKMEEACTASLSEISDRIATLNRLIEAKKPFLYYTTTETEWVED